MLRGHLQLPGRADGRRDDRLCARSSPSRSTSSFDPPSCGRRGPRRMARPAMSAPDAAAKPAGRRRYVGLAVAGAAALGLAGGGAFYFASQRARAPRRRGGFAGDDHRAWLRAEPLYRAGRRRTFEILNQSDRPVEWEILDGVMVVEERENIAPGFKQTLTAKLAPGDYRDDLRPAVQSARHAARDAVGRGSTIAARSASMRAFFGPARRIPVLSRIAEQHAGRERAGARGRHQGWRSSTRRAPPILRRARPTSSLETVSVSLLRSRQQAQRRCRTIWPSGKPTRPSPAFTGSPTGCSRRTASMVSRRSPISWSRTRGPEGAAAGRRNSRPPISSAGPRVSPRSLVQPGLCRARTPIPRPTSTTSTPISTASARSSN